MRKDASTNRVNRIPRREYGAGKPNTSNASSSKVSAVKIDSFCVSRRFYVAQKRDQESARISHDVLVPQNADLVIRELAEVGLQEFSVKPPF